MTATDFLQTLILIPITILVGVLCLVKLGGVGALFQGIQNMGLSSDYGVFNAPDQFPLRAYTYAWAIAMLLKNVIGYNTLTSAQRYFLVKDGHEAQKAAWLGFALMTAGAFLWFYSADDCATFVSRRGDGDRYSQGCGSGVCDCEFECVAAGHDGTDGGGDVCGDDEFGWIRG